MMWIKVRKFRRNIDSGNDDAAVLSRRDMLAGMGIASLFVVAGSALVAPSQAAARVDTPVAEPEAARANAAKAEVAECSAPERNLAEPDTADFSEFSSQYYRRRARRAYRRGYRRGFYRRPYWRRRYGRRSRVVCRRRWYRGRFVRVCRRVWW